jgi:adenine-specific DNA-methyltransferase
MGGVLMSAIDDLIAQIEDRALRERLKIETARIAKERKFGLVFEEHLPELTPLYNAEIRVGARVAKRGGDLLELWRVLSISEGQAVCMNYRSGEKSEFPIDEIMTVANFGEPIFPTLLPVDRVQNGPNDAPWHTLIEADNYHALQLLEYLYTGQVDCIYIDPPYNTGARDWKYNNDYVDSNDSWRHSKWLAMIKRRLLIAKKLLKPEGVLVIAIDDNELAHLVCLLKDIMPNYEQTIVTVVHNPRGNIKKNFAQTHEYAVYLVPKGEAVISRVAVENIHPRKLRRWGHNSTRKLRPTMFYPIYIKDGQVIRIGEVPPDEFHPKARNIHKGEELEIWPIDKHGIERRWNFGLDTIGDNLNRIVALPADDGQGMDLYLTEELSPPKTVWVAPELDAGGAYGSTLVEKTVGSNFPYPKSLYTVFQSIKIAVASKPNALILDFFAGSGTTLNAVNLLNAEDGGQRRCIMVTNNEVSEDEANTLRAKGLLPGNDEWEKHGICQAITWPRSKYTIFGHRDDGTVIEGEYLTGKFIKKEKPRNFYHVDFALNETFTTAARKKRFVRIIEGIPQSIVKPDSAFILSDNEKHFASVLFDDTQVDAWLDALTDHEHITDFYIVTERPVNFNKIKDQINELLGPMIVTEEKKRPIKGKPRGRFLRFTIARPA